MSNAYGPRWWLWFNGSPYRAIMRVAHRYGWHYAPGHYIEHGDFMRWCHWCGMRDVVRRCDPAISVAPRDTPRPLLRDYFDKWSIVAVSPHEQERSAREDFAMADRAWLERSLKEFQKPTYCARCHERMYP